MFIFLSPFWKMWPSKEGRGDRKHKSVFYFPIEFYVHVCSCEPQNAVPCTHNFAFTVCHHKIRKWNWSFCLQPTEAGAARLFLGVNVSQLFKDTLSIKNINYIPGIKPSCKLSLLGKNSTYCSAPGGKMWGWGNLAPPQMTIFVS